MMTTTTTTTRGALRWDMWSNRRHGGALGLAALAVALGAIGCGSSSSSTSNGPGEKFIGHWELDTVSSTFMVNCPVAGLSGAVPIFGELIFERGVLTDLTETSTSCLPPGVDFDADTKGTTLTAPNPDPYTSMPPECDWFVGNDANGPVIIKISWTALTFTLLQSSTANAAPTGLLAGTGSGPLVQIDPTTMQPAQTDTCTVSGTSDRFHQMTR
jgi:hypothetical protein